MAAEDPENNKETDNNNNDDEKEVTTTTPGQKLTEGVSMFYNYFILFLGVSLTGGLFLNLCGYGYVFSKAEGLRIDTLGTLREENQFRRVSKQYAREYSVTTSEAQPPSQLPQ
jgi:hypothetical protein